MPLTDVTGTARHPGALLVRAMGIWALAASVVNVTIGGSIFALPGTLASSMGSAAPLAFILGAALFIPIALCFAAAGSRISGSGGPYRYVESAFGRFPGIAVATIFWVSSAAGGSSIAAALADQLQHLVPALHESTARAALIVSIYASLVALNAWGVRAGAVAVIAFAVAKVIPLLMLTLAGAAFVELNQLRIPHLPNWSTTGNALVLVVFAYSGLETALAPSGEVMSPDKVVPRGTLLGVAVVIALYVGLQVVAQGVLGSALPGNAAPLVAVADRILPTVGGWLVVLTATVSLFGCLQGDLLGSSRLLYALAEDGFLPSPLARITTSRRVPLAAIVLHAVVACGLAIAGNFTALALMSGGAYSLVYISCCAAAWQLQRTDAGESAAPLKLWGGPLIPTIAVTGLLLVLSTLQRSEWMAIAAALAAVTALYGATQLAKRRR